MRTTILCVFVLAISLLIACHSGNQGGVRLIKADKDTPFDSSQSPFKLNPDSLLPIDFTQDLSQKTLAELRMLRSSVFARNGQLFKEPEIRGYFSSKYKWYSYVTTQIWSRIGDKVVNEPEITKQEREFVDKIDDLIKKKLKN